MSNAPVLILTVFVKPFWVQAQSLGTARKRGHHQNVVGGRQRWARVLFPSLCPLQTVRH